MTFVNKSDGKNEDYEKMLNDFRKSFDDYKNWLDDDIKKLDDHEERLREFELELRYEIKPKDALQISDTNAKNALDGDNATYAFTANELYPWWAANMGGKYQVKKVVVINTQNPSYASRAKNLRVGLTNTAPVAGKGLELDAYTLCGEKEGLMGDGATISCPDEVSGQYLIVQLKTTSLLLLAEVKIYGYKI